MSETNTTPTPNELANKVIMTFAEWVDEGKAWGPNGVSRTKAEEVTHWTALFTDLGCSDRFAFSSGKDAAELVFKLKARG